jgi:hypothetical protein
MKAVFDALVPGFPGMKLVTTAPALNADQKIIPPVYSFGLPP